METYFKDRPEYIGERITFLRKKVLKGLSQADFGEKIGRRIADISKWENGRAKIKSEDLESLAKVYKINLNWLVLGVGSPLQEAVVEENLIQSEIEINLRAKVTKLEQDKEIFAEHIVNLKRKIERLSE